MEIMRRDDQYMHLRDCASVPITVDKEFDFGIAKGCEAPLVWYSTPDHAVVTYEPDTLSFDRAEKTSNVPLKQTDAGTNSMTWEKAIELELNYSHRFIQALVQVYRDDYEKKGKGADLIEMSNGWIWMRERAIYNKGEENEYVEEWTYPYLKISEMTVPFTGLIDPEFVCAFTFLVETMPEPEEYGTKPASYGIPNEWPDFVFSNFVFDETKNSYDVVGYEGILWQDEDLNYKTYTQIFTIVDGEPEFLREDIMLVAGTVVDDTLTLENTYGTPLTTTEEYYIKVGVFFGDVERFFVKDYVMTITP